MKRDLKKKIKKNRCIEGESPPLYSSTKEQTKNHGHLITKALDQRKRACRNKERDGQGHEVHLSIRMCVSVQMFARFIWGRG